MDNTNSDALKIDAARTIGPLTYLVFLIRGPILVTLAMVMILVDLIIPGSMKEAVRYALLESKHWHQFVVIGLALLLASAAVRFSSQAIVELIAPDLFDRKGSIGRLAHLLPRLLAFVIGLAVAWPLIEILMDWNAFQSGVLEAGGGASSETTRVFAAIAAAAYILISFFVAVVASGPHATAVEAAEPSYLTRFGLALLPVFLATLFCAAVMGIYNPGISHHALERYSTAVLGAVTDVRQPNEGNTLWRWIYTSGAEDQARRYRDYIERTEVAPDISAAGEKPKIFISAKYSIPYVAAMLLSLLAVCYAVRIAAAVFLDLLFPYLANKKMRWLRNLLPALASTGLGAAVAGQFAYAYFVATPVVHLYGAEPWVAGAIILTYVGIGLLASFGAGSRYADKGSWQEAHSIGRRFVGAARRLSALDPFWHWYVRGLLILGLVLFIVFARLDWVAIPQWIGPIGIILLWGAAATGVIFILSYLGHATRIPFLSTIALACLVFAGFNINDNHGLRILEDAQPAPADPTKTGRTLELVKWMASRSDRDQYEHYPVFLVATEGGGIRAAYFTATVLAALQERCPAFALHTMAISGVSGGSLGAAVFSGLAADDKRARRSTSDCSLIGGHGGGDILKKARTTLSADLLSPLLGAMLFPDAMQRMLPLPIGSFDRSRALEHAIEHSWASASELYGGRPDRMSMSPMSLYAADNAVPNLLLNTTEAGKGEIVPYTTASILMPNYRGGAQIDDGNLDCGTPVDPGNCVMPLQQLKSLEISNSSDYPVALSTAAFVSARFPYLTPAGSLLDPDPQNPGRYLDVGGGHYVDGGYFENSGTFLLARVLENLVGDQQCLLGNAICPGLDIQNVDKSVLDAAKKAVFIVIVIQSEPCTRHAFGTSCEEARPVDSSTWSEALSPLRALLSTRATRATYSAETLRSMSALIESFRGAQADVSGMTDDAISCRQVVCMVTLRFLNRPNTDIPLTWLLSAGARHYMDLAVDGMVRADVRKTIPPSAVTDINDHTDIDRVLGSYRRVLCLLANRKGAGETCTPAASAPEN